MSRDEKTREPETRRAPLEMEPDEFRALGHRLIEKIADFLARLREMPVTPGEEPGLLRRRLGGDGAPAKGTDAATLLDEAADLLVEHSLLNGHPRFFGYITAAAAPIGALADLLAAAVNPNVGAWSLAPVATEIEAQTIRWIAELIGYPAGCGGLLVSGGNAANFVAFLAARRATADWDIRSLGLRGRPQRTVYVSEETHTWIQKAADLFGLGTDAIRWIPADRERRLDVGALERRIAEDRAAGHAPFLVVGTAGTVSFGTIDPLPALAALCRREGLWFHVDGAYGAPAAMLPEAPADLKALAEADSIAIDPHKWLYAPLEAGCVLVREPERLRDAFQFHPEYYAFEGPEREERTNFHEVGLQNSRGFRALKVWLALRQVGRDGYVRMIRDDIALTEALFEACRRHPLLEAATRSLSVATFRFVPADLRGRGEAEEYVDALNRELLDRVQSGGEAFLSNAVLDGRFLLRACVVNFRTGLGDVLALPEIVARVGERVDAEIRPGALRSGTGAP